VARKGEIYAERKQAFDATFYYDSEDQVLFDFVDYPVAV
jgi:hypothetical protein